MGDYVGMKLDLSNTKSRHPLSSAAVAPGRSKLDLDAPGAQPDSNPCFSRDHGFASSIE